MTHESSIADHTYLLLRSAVLAGILDPQTRIDFAELAMRFGVSTTPVREAAMRLLGEGLLELHPRGGLRPAFLSEQRLRALLEYHGRLAGLAVDWASFPIEIGTQEPSCSNEQRARALFRALARSSANSEFSATMERLADRLAPYRHMEVPLMGDVNQEYERLGNAMRHSLTAAKRELRSYHRRRLKFVSQLVWLAASASQASYDKV